MSDWILVLLYIWCGGLTAYCWYLKGAHFSALKVFEAVSEELQRLATKLSSVDKLSLIHI